MRDYALTCAMTAQCTDALPLRLLRNWRNRCQLRRGGAASYADSDLRWALSLPLSIDPLAALDERLFRRARGLLCS